MKPSTLLAGMHVGAATTENKSYSNLLLTEGYPLSGGRKPLTSWQHSSEILHLQHRAEEDEKHWLPEPFMGFPGGSDDKESTCNAADLGSIFGLGSSLEGGHGNPLQCLEDPHGQRSQAIVHGVAESQT